MTRVLMKGAEAVGEAAIKAGCRHFFGYPITPQNEIPEYMSRRLPQVGGTYVQGESEVASINMLFGCAGAGVRVMTSSSSPGISLMQEGISYIAGAELPVVVINMVRGGPGLGGIQPAQSDYFQATRGGGHGDYYTLVLAPSTVQEAVELVMDAFDLADKYRNPVLVLGDGIIGQMMEPVEFPEREPARVEKPWATTGCKGREPNIVKSLLLDPYELEEHNRKLQQKYERMKREDVRVETVDLESAEVVLCAYGTTSRVCRTAMERLKEKGVKVGLVRPITLFPFPEKTIQSLDPKKVKFILTVEMSLGQMVQDVRLYTEGRIPVHFYGRTGGVVPTPQEVVREVLKRLGKEVEK